LKYRGKFHKATQIMLRDANRPLGKFGRKVIRNAIRTNVAYKPGKLGSSWVCDQMLDRYGEVLSRYARRHFHKSKIPFKPIYNNA